MNLDSKLPMNLQLFAEGEAAETIPDNVEATPEGAQTVETEPTVTEPTVKVDADPIKVAKYTDDDVNKMINQKFAKWQKEREESEQKAKSREKMSETERAKAELDEREAELTRKTLMFDYREKVTADGMSPKVLELMNFNNALDAEESYQRVKDTINEVCGDFETRLAEGIKAGVEERLRGNSITVGSTGTAIREESEGARIARQQNKTPAKSHYFKH